MPADWPKYEEDRKFGLRLTADTELSQGMFMAMLETVVYGKVTDYAAYEAEMNKYFTKLFHHLEYGEPKP